MLINRLKVAGLLSFGPEGIDLPLQGLSVLIGPNGSGKSNLIEVLGLLQAAPRSLSDPLNGAGGLREWVWKGKPAASRPAIEADVGDPDHRAGLRHRMIFTAVGGSLGIGEERIAPDGVPGPDPDAEFLYDNSSGLRRIRPGSQDELRPWAQLGPLTRPAESVLSQLKDPDHYPAFARLQSAYEGIRLYRNWSLGPASPLRRPQVAAGPADAVSEDLSNYQRVVWNMRKESPDDLIQHLSLLYEGAEDLHLDPLGDTVLLSIRETNTGWIPITRLSDGTVRYLCLLAILLNPTPPPLIVIDEPDLGLHPDLMPTLATLLVQASERTQVIATTHSRALIDALSDRPEAVVVCGKDAAGTFFERLDQEQLAHWLEKYSLGQLWSRGEFGGNRW